MEHLGVPGCHLPGAEEFRLHGMQLARRRTSMPVWASCGLPVGNSSGPQIYPRLHPRDVGERPLPQCRRRQLHHALALFPRLEDPIAEPPRVRGGDDAGARLQVPPAMPALGSQQLEKQPDQPERAAYVEVSGRRLQWLLALFASHCQATLPLPLPHKDDEGCSSHYWGQTHVRTRAHANGEVQQELPLVNVRGFPDHHYAMGLCVRRRARRLLPLYII